MVLIKYSGNVWLQTENYIKSQKQKYCNQCFTSHGKHIKKTKKSSEISNLKCRSKAGDSCRGIHVTCFIRRPI